MIRLPIFLAILGCALAPAQDLPPATQGLLEQARAANPERYQYAIDQGARVFPTSDGRSFYLYWAPKGNQPVIATLHGESGWAFDEFTSWHDEALNAGHGILALQWWLGSGDSAESYYAPSEIHRELRAALQQSGATEGSVLLHGFSRGAANLYGVAALDRQSKDRLYGMFLANAGGAAEDFPANAAITNGSYGYNVFSGTYWGMFCGGLDRNPDRDGCPAMRRTSGWVTQFGGVTDLFLQDDAAGHNGFQQSPSAQRAVLQAFARNITLRTDPALSRSTWQVQRDTRFEIQNASTPNVGLVGGEVWLAVGGQNGTRFYRSADGSNASYAETIPSLVTAFASTGFTATEVVPRDDGAGNPVFYVLALAPPGTNRSAVYRMFRTGGSFVRNPSTPVFQGAPEDQQFLGVPDITPTWDGGLRLTYIARGAARSNARSAISYDGGASFQPEFPNLFGDLGRPDPRPTDINVDPAILKLSTGGYLAVTMRGARLFLFTSVDGRTFIPVEQDAIEASALAPGATGLFDPTLIELPDGHIFLYATAGDNPGAASRVVRAELIRRPPKLTLRSTTQLPVGTSRPEMAVTSRGEIIVVVAEAKGQVRHRAYRYSSNWQPIGDPFAVTSVTDEFGEPRDHRIAIVNDELLVVYQSAGNDQSLLFARLSLDGTEIVRTPLVQHVASTEAESFAEHCLLWRGDHLLISTGSSAGILHFRKVDLSGNVLAATNFVTSADGFPNSTGNSLLSDGARLWLLSGTNGFLTAMRFTPDLFPDSVVFFQDASREQRLPVSNVVAGAWIYASYESRARDTQNAFAPYLKIFSRNLSLIGDQPMGEAGSHPSIAGLGNRLLFAWTTATGQVRVDDYVVEAQ